jgi:hypothetical protein
MVSISSIADINKLCMTIFKGAEESCTYFVVPLALSRIVYATVSGDDGSTIKETLKGVLLYFILIYGFEYVLDILLQIPQAFLPNFSYDVLANGSERSRDLGVAEVSYLPRLLEYGINTVLGLLFWCAVFFHVLFMSIMCGMAPIVFLLGGVLGIGFGIRVFFGLLVVSSSWPVMWAAFDQLGQYLSAKGRGDFGDYVIEGVTLALKAIGPLVMGYASANSGVGRMAVGALGTSLGIGKSVVGKVSGQRFSRNLSSGRVGIGRSTSTKPTQPNNLKKPWKSGPESNRAQRFNETSTSKHGFSNDSPGRNAHNTPLIGRNTESQSRFFTHQEHIARESHHEGTLQQSGLTGSTNNEVSSQSVHSIHVAQGSLGFRTKLEVSAKSPSQHSFKRATPAHSEIKTRTHSVRKPRKAPQKAFNNAMIQDLINEAQQSGPSPKGR